MATTSPVEVEPDLTPDEITLTSKPWVTLVWNDPVNLMSYVTYVFRTYFGYDEKKAEKLMLEVHHDGKSAVSNGSREEMERDVQAMHEYGLWATLENQWAGPPDTAAAAGSSPRSRASRPTFCDLSPPSSWSSSATRPRCPTITPTRSRRC